MPTTTFTLRRSEERHGTDVSVWASDHLRTDVEVARFVVALGELRQLILLPDAAYHDTNYALRLAVGYEASHATADTVLVSMPVSKGFTVLPRHRMPVTPGDALASLQGLEIPAQLDGEANIILEGELAKRRVDVIHARYAELSDALESVAAQPLLGDQGIKFEVLPHTLGDYLTPHFRVRATTQNAFTFWPNVDSHPNMLPKYSELSDHPANKHALPSLTIRAGERNVTGGRALKRIEPPAGSLGNDWKDLWSDIAYPFYAIGNDVLLEVSSTLALQNDGIIELLEALVGMAGINNRYAAVTDGFLPPSEFWMLAERLRETNELPGTEREAAHLLWAYSTAAKQGQVAEVDWSRIYGLGDWLDVLAKHYPSFHKV